MPSVTIFQDSEDDHWRVRHGFLEYKTDEVLPVSDIPEFIEWLQSEYAKHKPEAKADDDGWIKWDGGECPVDESTRVDVMWAGGATDLDYRAKEWYWGDANLKAYRLSK